MNNKINSHKLQVTRRKFIKSMGIQTSGLYFTGLSCYEKGLTIEEEAVRNEYRNVFFQNLKEDMPVVPYSKQSAFMVRATQDTGWNVFKRKGYSTKPKDIEVNFSFLDYLSQSGINWLLVFWTNAPEFNSAWIKASEYAHSLGLKIGRAIYGFSGGGPETSMTEPNVPEYLLKPSSKGPKTVLCPFDPAARQWVIDSLSDRIQPNIDGIIIEPAPETGRKCLCEKCSSLRTYQWNEKIINIIADRLIELKPNIQIMLHLNAANKSKDEKQIMASDLARLRKQISHIFAWGTDNEESLRDWLDADPRFDAFTKVSRVILFPGGKVPALSTEERVAKFFRWCSIAADKNKTGYSVDWRYFGGTEWNGYKKEYPTTRILRKMPASLMIMGAAMQNPYLDRKEQQTLIQRLRVDSEWDLDNPGIFYNGVFI